MLRCSLRAVFADYRRRAKRDLGVRGGACGSVTFIQRFGSALNLTPHFHTLVLDGTYEGAAGSPGRFHALDPPEIDDVARRILDCLRMPSRAPPLAASKPRAEERLEEPSSELDWGDNAGFDFDQSGPEPA